MRTTGAILAIVLLTVSPAWAQKIEPIRRGWNAFNGTPHNFCSWLVVSGPEVAKRNILEQAKKSYSEPDATRLAAVEGKVFVEILTLTERSQRCSNRIMKEVIVLLSAVVQPDGTVTDATVLQSLDPEFGLDDEVLNAARRWQFVPGTRDGKPVPVLVAIAIALTLR